MSISDNILNNIQNLLILKQDAAASIAKAARALMLDPQSVGLLKVLDRGEAVARVAGWPDPVLVKVLFVPPHRGSSTTPLPPLQVVPAKRLRELKKLQDALTRATGELGRARKGAGDAPARILQYAHDVVADWVKRRGKTLARIWETLEIDQPGRQDAIRKALGDYAVIRDVRLGSTKVALLLPTEAGWALVGRQPPQGQGRGEIVHLHGAWWAYDWAVQQGYEAHLEWLVPKTTHPADVGYCVGGAWHVIEIAVTCFDNLADAVRASLVVSNAVESVTIVTTLKSEHPRVRRVLAAPDLAGVLDRVHFSTFDHYLREVYA